MRTTHGPHARLGGDVQRRPQPAAVGSSTRMFGARDSDWRVHVRDERETHPSPDAGPAWFDAVDRSEGRFSDAES